jgi:hypothetical protein
MVLMLVMGRRETKKKKIKFSEAFGRRAKDDI